MNDKEFVSECDGSGDILYQMIMDGKFGYKLSPLINIRWRKRDIVLSAFKEGTFPKPIKKIIGHEILFRPIVGSEKQLPRHCIGSAFGQMTANGQQMLEAYPVLLEEQLKVVNKYPNKKSINLEYLVWTDDNASDKVFQLLHDNGSAKLRLEIKEDGMMPEWTMCEIACICEAKGIGIYIDDLAMKVNNVPENIEYFQKIIKHLHHYIKAVKVDYEWVHRMKGDPSVKRHIGLNLHDFWYIWKSYTNISLPRVIFESVPFDRIDAMNIIFEMTAKYKYGKCHFQSEEEPRFRSKKIF